MFKKAVLFVTGFALLLALPYRPQAKVQSQGKDKITVDKVVAVVGNSIILYSDVDELSKQILQQRREQGYTLDRDAKVEALEALMMQKLLHNQALIDSLDEKMNLDDLPAMVDERVQQAVNSVGSIAALEKQYHKPIFEIKEDMRYKFEEMRYAQRMKMEVEDKVTVTPGEVEKYYKSINKDSLPIIPEQYVYAQITKFPESMQEAKQRAKERLLEMKERIQKGTRFDVLARMYSIDPGSKMRGGEMDLAPKETFVKPFGDALSKLKVGQISEVVETEFGFHIIELMEKRDNLYRMRHILIKPEYTEEETAQTCVMLDSLVTLIRAGELKFEDAALKNSDDPFSRYNGGLVSNHDMLEAYNAFDAKLTTTKFFKEELQRDYLYLKNLKPGEISNAFPTEDLRGNALAKVVKLLDIIPAHPASLKDDYLKLEDLALENKKEKIFKEWLDKKIESMYIRIEPEFKSSDFENKKWLK